MMFQIRCKVCGKMRYNNEFEGLGKTCKYCREDMKKENNNKK